MQRACVQRKERKKERKMDRKKERKKIKEQTHCYYSGPLRLFCTTIDVSTAIGYLLMADGENALLVDATDADRCE